MTWQMNKHIYSNKDNKIGLKQDKQKGNGCSCNFSFFLLGYPEMTLIKCKPIKIKWTNNVNAALVNRS